MVRIGGQDVVVAGVAGDAWYGHQPVLWADLTDWQWMADGFGPGTPPRSP